MAQTNKRDRQLETVLAAVRDHAGPGRSPLYRWMRLRHDALLQAFTEAPPNWAIFAQTVAGLGITDAERKPPSPEVARQTWYRVRRDVSAYAARRSKLTPVLARDEIAPAVRSVAPEAERPQRMKLDIKPRTGNRRTTRSRASGFQGVSRVHSSSSPAGSEPRRAAPARLRGHGRRHHPDAENHSLIRSRQKISHRSRRSSRG